jgi:hypothetical protein
VFKGVGHKNFAKSKMVVHLFTSTSLYDVTDSRHNNSTSATLFPASPSQKIHFNKINSASIAGLHPQKPLSLSMTTFSVRFTNLTALLQQLQDGCYCVSRRKLAPAPLWVHKQTDLRAHDFAHSPDL